MVSVKVDNQTSSTLSVYLVTKVVSTSKPTSVSLGKLVGTVKSNKTKSLDAEANTLLLITGQHTKAGSSLNLQAQDVLFEVGASGGMIMVGSGTTLTKALMWAFLILMIILIIVVIVLLVVHFKRNHEQAKVAAKAADALVAANNAKSPAALPAHNYTKGHDQGQ